LRNNFPIENNKYMKVAVLFRGQPRFVKNKVAYESHKKFIFDNYDTDVFIHTWWAEDMDEYETATWSSIPVCKPESDVIDFIKSIYNPKRIEVEKPIVFKEDLKLIQDISERFKHEIPEKWKNISNFKSQLYSLEKVGNLLRESDYSNYDWIIVSRLDNFITKFPNLSNLDNNYFHLQNNHPRFPDPLFVFSPKFINFLNTWKDFEESIRVSQCLVGESIMQQVFLKYYDNSQLRQIEDMWSMYVRDENGSVRL